MTICLAVAALTASAQSSAPVLDGGKNTNSVWFSIRNPNTVPMTCSYGIIQDNINTRASGTTTIAPNAVFEVQVDCNNAKDHSFLLEAVYAEEHYSLLLGID